MPVMTILRPSRFIFQKVDRAVPGAIGAKRDRDEDIAIHLTFSPVD
jgi:hypothetical protein